MEKISAIITTHGRDFKMLRRAIDSAINQTYPFIEILVVDDNGRGTPIQQTIEKNIHTYYEDQVTYLVNEKNEGAQYSRNRGILASQGDFLCFLDDDDMWNSNKNEKQIKLFNHPEIGLAYSNVLITDYSNKCIQTYKKPNFKENFELKDLFWSNCIGSPCQVMIRKSVFCDVGLFDSEFPACQDYEMWIRIYLKYKCVAIAEPLCVYNLHTGLRISSQGWKLVQGRKLIVKKYKQYILPSRRFNYHLSNMFVYKGLKNIKLLLIESLFATWNLVQSVIIDNKNYRNDIQPLLSEIIRRKLRITS